MKKKTVEVAEINEAGHRPPPGHKAFRATWQGGSVVVVSPSLADPGNLPSVL
jgi:hypothetical protein